MEYYSVIKRNAFDSILIRQMNLEVIMQSEVSQKEKNQICHINTDTWDVERWYWGTYLQGRSGDADIENRLLDTVGKEMVRQIESTIETYTLLYAKLGSQWKFAVCCRELTSGTLWQPRRMAWGGRWERVSRGRGHMYTTDWFVLMYGKDQPNIVKQLSSNFKKHNFFKK